ncbi:MAG TPA: M28 family peptidase, partial [Thermodesulfobacteriota bacterium]|nr:M28 family peptidase [Thermodesulfobacteriota bacterium]
GDAGTYFQKFPLPDKVIPGKHNSLILAIDGHRKELELGRDFFPLSLSASGTVSGELVFAGYGISAPEQGYDDYGDVDVRGKIVLILRGSPSGIDYRSHLYDYASLRYKSLTAADKGAKGIIFTTPESMGDEEDLESFAFELPSETPGVEAVIVKRERAQEIVAAAGRDLAHSADTLGEGKSGSFYIPSARAEIGIDLQTVHGVSANVLGFLPGSDPELRDEFVVIGAHYDHLGNGGGYTVPGPEKGAIYNGADDNASGVSGLIELGNYFASGGHGLKRSLLFIAFSGEEIGLLGSTYYIEHPGVPPEKTVAMINMDMIGRLTDNKLNVLGVGSAKEWKDLVDKANSGIGLGLTYVDQAFGPSDQTVFFGDRIPAVLFFTGLHKDYHTPDDDWQKINYDGEARVLELAANLVTELGDGESVIEFSGGSTGYAGPPGLRVYLGTIPEYAGSGNGVKLAGVRKGSPAEKAGLRENDTIIELDGIKIRNVYDYRDALAVSDPGIGVDIVILRAGKRMTLNAVPEAR